MLNVQQDTIMKTDVVHASPALTAQETIQRCNVKRDTIQTRELLRAAHVHGGPGRTNKVHSTRVIVSQYRQATRRMRRLVPPPKYLVALVITRPETRISALYAQLATIVMLKPTRPPLHVFPADIHPPLVLARTALGVPRATLTMSMEQRLAVNAALGFITIRPRRPIALIVLDRVQFPKDPLPQQHQETSADFSFSTM